MKKHLLSGLIILLLAISMQMTVFAEGEVYIHGYFRYTVADQSVTITAYTGKEESVTVPAMIGGNPVNVIASGAFADNKTVKEILLPDTIMSVEDGAFNAGQSVIYQNNENGNDQSAEDGSNLTGPVGIRMDNGNLITVDDQGNLVMVDAKSGVERVLDDSQTYQVTKDSKGNVVIKSKDGSSVTVQPGNIISYTDGNNNKVNVTVDKEGNTTINKTDPEGNQESEELDVGGDNTSTDESDADESDTGSDKNSEKDSSATEKTDSSGSILIICLLVVVVAAGIVFFYRKKKKKSV